MNRYHHKQISRYTYNIVENDPYGQYPFLYAIMGVDKCVVIDTGTGIGNFAEYLDAHINKDKLPYLVINTHVHFDHVGGNHYFTKKAGFRGIHMSGADQKFSKNVEINSLCLAHHCTVKHFEVDHWLKEGDRIYLDDKNKTPETSLEIIEAPGHTPDSIAIYSHLEKLLFIGDNIYPYTVVHLDCLGSNTSHYVATLHKLNKFIATASKAKAGELKFPKPEDEKEGKKESKEDKNNEKKVEKEKETKEAEGMSEKDNEEKEGKGEEGKTVSKEGNSSEKQEDKKEDKKDQETKSNEEKKDQETKSKEDIKEKTPKPHPQQKLIDEFCALIAKKPEDLNFSIDSFLRLTNYQIENMVDFFFTSGSALPQMCPKEKKSAAKPKEANSTKPPPKKEEKKTFGVPTEIKICCGHVETGLNPSAINDILTLLEIVKIGGVHPSHIDSGFGEYTNGTFSIMMPLKPKW